MSHACTHLSLGTALQKKGDLKGAIDEYRIALRVNPNEADARYNLAVALHAKGDLVSSRKEYKKALKLIPKAPENQAQIKSIKSVLSELAGALP